MAWISPQPDFRIVGQGSRNISTRTAHSRNDPGMSEGEFVATIPHSSDEEYAQQEGSRIQRGDIFNQEWDARARGVLNWELDILAQESAILARESDILNQVHDAFLQRRDTRIVFERGDVSRSEEHTSELQSP